MYKSKRLTGLVLVMFMLTMVLGATPGLAGAATTPSDIMGHWAQPEIQKMLDQGNASGYPDGSYRPDFTITRAEFMSMVNRTFGFTNTVPISFTDVQPGDWFYNDVAIAAAHKYVAGYEDNTMRPNSQITRQEMAVIVAQLYQMDMTDMQVLFRFTDQGSIPFWSRGALAAMVKGGYFNGFPDGALKGEIPTNRGMAAYVLARVFGDHGKPPITPPGPPVTPPGQGGSSGGGGGSNFEIVSVAADNLNITPNARGTKNFTVSEKTISQPVGDLDITFSKPIKKASAADITLRVYNDAGVLLGTNDALPKAKLFAEFGSDGNPNVLDCTMDLDYEALMMCLDWYYPGQLVTKVETDVYAKNGDKLTVTLNLDRADV